ncbi:hypothetical protein K438DRAFT_1757799 [Mycena galopus ATCC 62051]|nr:hypothetical protein K438DRAFT_1757799 [Mycena galopus ATCC 62051]
MPRARAERAYPRATVDAQQGLWMRDRPPPRRCKASITIFDPNGKINELEEALTLFFHSPQAHFQSVMCFARLDDEADAVEHAPPLCVAHDAVEEVDLSALARVVIAWRKSRDKQDRGNDETEDSDTIPLTILRPRRRVYIEIYRDPILARPADEADDVLSGRRCQREALEYTRQDNGRIKDDGGEEIRRGERKRGVDSSGVSCYLRLRLQQIRGVGQRLRGQRKRACSASSSAAFEAEA